MIFDRKIRLFVRLNETKISEKSEGRCVGKVFQENLDFVSVATLDEGQGTFNM